jgi:hypothetical protein
MEQQQFEQAVLGLVHREGQTRLRAVDVANRFRMQEREAESLLDRMVTEGRLELDSDDDGNLFYFVPGMGVAGVFNPGAALGPSAGTPTPRPLAPAAWSGPSGPGGPPPGWQGAPQPSGWTGGQAPPPGWNAAAASPPAAGWGAPPPSPWNAAQPQAPQRGPHAGHAPQPGWGAPPPGSHPPQAWGPSNAAPSWQQPGYGPPPPSFPPRPTGWQGQAPSQGPQWNAQPQQGAPSWGTAPHYAPQQTHAQHVGAWHNPNAMVPHASAHYPQAMPGSQVREPKSPTTSALLSLFFPGAGQLYNGQVGKGLTFFFLTMMLLAAFPFCLIPWVWSMVDAHETSRRMNNAYGLLPP